MKQLVRRRPSAAMIIAIIALVAALAGTAVAGGGFLTKKKFGKFKSTAVVGLTYVTKTFSLPNNPEYQQVSADCPPGLKPVGGGVKLTPEDTSIWWGDGYLTATGYHAAIDSNAGPSVTAEATVTLACAHASSTGTLPAS